ncbi:energy-coupling factor transporter transmembrane component T family protein [Eubacterium oxidoreducens]|uniref:Energy-coupling factor transport system permease protein n=1 Tax=Eubacterium oxidoreducens TaxID=1732 RepID=A0A1G6CE25_EUBOX|nr:energy-coupling factor transporter transmembrane component T [Eubacterium oxidoreducens]SDB31146.1 energy-coupling factor transport system permease protein [Eubacterium oxidoreducens]
MVKDITLGQYYPTESVINRLDPRVKLLGTLVYLISLFIFRGWPGFVWASVFLGSVIYLSKIPLGYVLKGVRGIYILCIITAFFNVFFKAGTPLVQLGMVIITEEGVYNAVFMSLRLIYLVIGASVMTLSTTPAKLTDGIETGCAFMKRWNIPVHEIAMMMTIALRFIPILMEEADKIKKAQMARGADFESGNLVKRAKAMLPILVPLFVSAFRRANDLSVAMEARCYHGGEGRTKLHPLVYGHRDYCAYVILAIYFAAMIVIRVIVEGKIFGI